MPTKTVISDAATILAVIENLSILLSANFINIRYCFLISWCIVGCKLKEYFPNIKKSVNFNNRIAIFYQIERLLSVFAEYAIFPLQETAQVLVMGGLT
jgi:hypothetical protein